MAEGPTDTFRDQEWSVHSRTCSCAFAHPELAPTKSPVLSREISVSGPAENSVSPLKTRGPAMEDREGRHESPRHTVCVLSMITAASGKSVA